jgi:ABC-type transporter Mla MlaB component
MARRTIKTGRCVLDGALTVRGIEDARSKLLEMIKRHSVVEVDCSSATDVDLSFIQLLLAARVSARQSAKTIQLAHPAAGPLQSALVRGGFLESVAGRPAAGDSFWLGGEVS